MSYNSDRSVKSVAESLGITSAMLYRWREIYTAEGDKTEAAEQSDEIKALRAKLRELEEENDMLKKVHDFFTKNQD